MISNVTKSKWWRLGGERLVVGSFFCVLIWLLGGGNGKGNSNTTASQAPAVTRSAQPTVEREQRTIPPRSEERRRSPAEIDAATASLTPRPPAPLEEGPYPLLDASGKVLSAKTGEKDWPRVKENDVALLNATIRDRNPDGLLWLGKKKPRVRIYTDHYGTMLWEMEPGHAPRSVENFLLNCREEGYMNTNRAYFYRYESNFVLQGGAWYGNRGRKVPLEYSLSNTKYTIALARTGSNTRSGGSEWFINLGNNARHLKPDARKGGGYAVFARLISGFDTLARIQELPVNRRNGMTKIALPTPKIVKVVVFES